LVSNAPRVHASDRAPAFAAPPFAMAASRDVVSGASARAVRPPVSARACLEHLCRALASLGVGVVPTEVASRGSRDRPRRALTAETLRRAKFDAPDASAPLWRAIHDLFLVCAAGFPNPSVAADALARVRGDADDVEDATCAALARHRLAEAGYPRARDLESLPPRDGRSRPLLLALAWAVHRADVFARAHADAHAPNLASAAPGASRSPLPPSPPDSAASPAAARAAAARALAEERAYVDDARAALDACRDEHDAVVDGAPSSSASAARLGRRREPLPLAARTAARVRAEAGRAAGVRAQTPIFAQRLWQTLSHVEALERARASGRVRLRDARREFAASFGDPSSAPARPPLPSTAYEVLLSRDADARGAHAAAMEATMEATRAASDAISAATTFYAWIESALALEDERREDEDDDEDESSSSDVTGHVNGHDRSRVLGDAIRAVASAARRAGPALRSRRRGVEAIANAWSRARRRAEEDHDEAERLAKRSERAANGLPTFDTFREGGTSERCGGGTSEQLGDRGTSERFGGGSSETPAKTSLADLAPAMFADATPPPEDVEAALVARGATLRKVTNETRDESPGASGEREPSAGDVAESRSARGGSSPETPEDAAARLGELARASEAALARTRRRARAFLATRVEAVFGRDEEGDPAPAVYTGWSEDEPS